MSDGGLVLSTVCLPCRRVGPHADVPNNDDDATGGSDAMFCYSCGNKGHRLSACPTSIVTVRTLRSPLVPSC
eukprot:jgi/Mesen1/2179/ME000152S01270